MLTIHRQIETKEHFEAVTPCQDLYTRYHELKEHTQPASTEDLARRQRIRMAYPGLSDETLCRLSL